MIKMYYECIDHFMWLKIYGIDEKETINQINGEEDKKNYLDKDFIQNKRLDYYTNII
jgi:hypothetical protein